MNRSGPDWASLIAPVAERLLGKPTRKTAREWRYGSKGSLVVHVGGSRAGRWHDFQADEGGGVLKLIQHKLACDKAGALRWLELEGFLEGKTAKEGRRAPETAPRMPRHRVSGESRASEGSGRESAAPRSKTTEIARRIVSGSVSAKGTPAARYLDRRGTWTDGEAGPLPDSLRWCPGDAAPVRLPDGAAGVLVWRLTDCDTGEPVPDAVQVEALTDDGKRLPERWRRSYGQITGRCFQAGDSEASVLVLAEGPCDGLALARLSLPGVMIRAALSSGALPALARAWTGKVLVCLDGDAAGRSAAEKVREARPDARMIHGKPGHDPDDWLHGVEAPAWGAEIARSGGDAAEIEAALSDLADPGRMLRRRNRRRQKARAARPWWKTPSGLPDLTPYRPRRRAGNVGADRRWGGQIERDWRIQ